MPLEFSIKCLLFFTFYYIIFYTFIEDSPTKINGIADQQPKAQRVSSENAVTSGNENTQNQDPLIQSAVEIERLKNKLSDNALLVSKVVNYLSTI